MIAALVGAALTLIGCQSSVDITTPTPTQQTPHGPEIRYAPLAILKSASIEDCRIPFATLSDRALLYRGGDGQEAFAPEAAAPTPIALGLKLRVAVMRGATPVPGAKVRWRMPAVAGIKSWRVEPVHASDYTAQASAAAGLPPNLPSLFTVRSPRSQDCREPAS